MKYSTITNRQVVDYSIKIEIFANEIIIPEENLIYDDIGINEEVIDGLYQSINDDYNEKLNDLYINYEKNSRNISEDELSADIDNLSIENQRRLEENGFTVFNVDAGNLVEISEEISTDVKSFFNQEMLESSIPPNITISIYNFDKNLPEEDTSYKLRTAYVTAKDDPFMAKTDTVNVYKKYNGFPYNESMRNILNRTFNLSIGFGTKYLWAGFALFNIDVNSIGTSQRESMYVTLNANWTKKFTQVYDDYLKM